MMQEIGAPTYFVSLDRRVYSRKSSSHLVIAAGALALSLSAGLWTLLQRPAAPKAANAAAPTAAQNPYGALVGFGGRARTALAPTLRGEFEGRIEAAAHTPPAVIPERQEIDQKPVTTAAAEAESAAEGAPLPPRRPVELSVQASRGLFQGPLRRMAGRTVVPISPEDNRSIFEKFFGLGDSAQPARPQASGQALAYAAPETGAPNSLLGSPRGVANPSPGYDRQTAIYDISAHTVYMPNGARLEAHSGLREHLDNPRYVHVRMRGPTPPHVYDLSPREALFHGVEALRLTPIGGEGAIFGRAGLLAHTYMLGPNGDSNGCVSFRDYQAFLRAYKNGEVKRLVVVAHM